MNYISIRTILLLSALSLFAYINPPEQTLASDSKIVATINDASITEEDLEFNQLVNRIQLRMNREAAREHLQGKALEESLGYWDKQEQALMDRNTLLTQIIRLRAAALLAKEKGYSATETEVKKEINNAKQIYLSQPAALEMIKEYGEEHFWKQENLQYQDIVLAKKVQRDVVNKVKQEHPQALKKEINFLADKAYEELLISQMDTLKITFVKK